MIYLSIIHHLQAQYHHQYKRRITYIVCQPCQTSKRNDYGLSYIHIFSEIFLYFRSTLATTTTVEVSRRVHETRKWLCLLLSVFINLQISRASNAEVCSTNTTREANKYNTPRQVKSSQTAQLWYIAKPCVK